MTHFLPAQFRVLRIELLAKRFWSANSHKQCISTAQFLNSVSNLWERREKVRDLPHPLSVPFHPCDRLLALLLREFALNAHVEVDPLHVSPLFLDWFPPAMRIASLGPNPWTHCSIVMAFVLLLLDLFLMVSNCCKDSMTGWLCALVLCASLYWLRAVSNSPIPSSKSLDFRVAHPCLSMLIVFRVLLPAKCQSICCRIKSQCSLTQSTGQGLLILSLSNLTLLSSTRTLTLFFANDLLWTTLLASCRGRNRLGLSANCTRFMMLVLQLIRSKPSLSIFLHTWLN